MADQKLVAGLLDKFKAVTLKPETFLSANNDVASKFEEWTKVAYDVLKSTDTLPDSEALPLLLTEGFDEEQIWQELELQNVPAIDEIVKDISVLKTSQVSFQDNVSGRNESEEVEEDLDDDQNDEDFADESDMSDDEDIPLGVEVTENLDVENDSGSESEEEKELKKLLDKAESMDKDEVEGDESDEDEGNLFGSDLEGEETSGKKNKGKVGGSNESESKGRETPGQYKKAKKRKTVVDDRFFNIADLETYLDNEDAKEEKRRRKEEKRGDSDSSDSDDEEDDEEVDFFADVPSDEEAVSSRKLRYKDFFDPPTGEFSEQKSDAHKEVLKDQDEMSEDDDGGEPSTKKDLFGDNDSGEEELTGPRSTFELRQERLAKKIKDMEETNLAPKSWQLGGEVAGAARPENSLLQEDLDFEQQTRLAPEITEETTKTLEDIIKQRIKDQSWDDVERKVKPVDTPLEYKKKVVLDMEKSKKSLSEMYEEEYLKQAEREKEDVEDPAHGEIKKMMTSLFIKLDALSNFHYTPKPAESDVKVISNLPSVTVEEVAPVSVSEAAMLAPEEIKEKQQRELKGDTEKTKEDKKSERRLKKQSQRKRRAEKEKRRKLVEKLNPGLGNKYAKQNAMDDLEKQSKGTRSNVTIIKDGKANQKSDLTSSSKFFTKLQDQMSSRIKDKKGDSEKKKKKQKQSSSAKLML